MAPAIASPQPPAPHDLPSKADNKAAVDTSVFPDGIKTSGQLDPVYERLHPYADFPKEISGPTHWKASDYDGRAETWSHVFSEQELADLSRAADEFAAAGEPLTGINPANFTLSEKFISDILAMRNELLNGKGFILYKGFPVEQWGNHKSAIAYFGLGSYLGYPVSQNSRGHILGHVKDLGEDSTQIDKVRIYRTNARQYFHADDCDIVGLLCIARSMEGGESDMASSHEIWNVLQKERPDVAELFTKPIWYFDRKGETSKGQQDWIKSSIFYLETAVNGRSQRVYSKYDPYFVRSLTRFSDKGLIPALSEEQKEAMDVLEDVCNRIRLHMILEVGDIQFLHNGHILHARTAYKDWAPGTKDENGKERPRRHLMRLWLATPEDEGGWRLPFDDSKEKKRGGIQVDDTPPVARLDAD